MTRSRKNAKRKKSKSSNIIIIEEEINNNNNSSSTIDQHSCDSDHEFRYDASSTEYVTFKKPLVNNNNNNTTVSSSSNITHTQQQQQQKFFQVSSSFSINDNNNNKDSYDDDDDNDGNGIHMPYMNHQESYQYISNHNHHHNHHSNNNNSSDEDDENMNHLIYSSTTTTKNNNNNNNNQSTTIVKPPTIPLLFASSSQKSSSQLIQKSSSIPSTPSSPHAPTTPPPLSSLLLSSETTHPSFPTFSTEKKEEGLLSRRRRRITNPNKKWWISRVTKFKVFTLVFLAAIGIIVMRSFDFVLLVRMAVKMHNYDLFLSSILLATIFNCVYWPIVWFRILFTKQITREMRQFPWYKFFIMGVLDCIAATIATLIAGYVNGPVNVVVSQVVILSNMVLSFFYLGSRYNVMHVGGMMIVLIGIGIDVFPLFMDAADHMRSDNSGSSSGSSGSGAKQEYSWYLILILICNSLPMAASNCYKERCLKDANLDIWYTQAWVMFWQLIFGIVTFPIILLRLPAPYTSISIHELPHHLWSGVKCAAGRNTLPDDMCEGFYWVLLVFIFFNLSFSYCMLYVFKHGSSTLAVIAGAARIALSNIGFLIPVLAGEATMSRLTPFDIEAVVFQMIGVVMYSSTREYRIPGYSIPQYLLKLVRKVRRLLEYLISCVTRGKTKRCDDDEGCMDHSIGENYGCYKPTYGGRSCESDSMKNNTYQF